MKTLKTSLLACGIALSLLALAGCGKKDPAEAVRQRAVERWDLLGGKHAVKAYDYLSPGYRSTHTLEQYVAFVATARVNWKSAKVDSVQCEQEVCTATLTVTSILPGALLRRPTDMEYSAPVVEKWVSSEGQWYFLPDSKIDAKGIAEQIAGARQTLAPGAEPSSAPAPKSQPEPPAPADAGKRNPPAETGKQGQ